MYRAGRLDVHDGDGALGVDGEAKLLAGGHEGVQHLLLLAQDRHVRDQVVREDVAREDHHT